MVDRPHRQNVFTSAEWRLDSFSGTASALLKHLESRGLSDAPQVAEAIACLTGRDMEQTAEWLQGQTATRASAVAAAGRLIADGSAALLQKKTSELSNI